MAFDAATFLANLAAPVAPVTPAPPVDREPVLLPYKPPEAWDAADVAVWEAGQGLRPIWTATSGTPEESHPGVPTGWTRASWTRRLEYMIGVCIVPERRAELRRMLEKVR